MLTITKSTSVYQLESKLKRIMWELIGLLLNSRLPVNKINVLQFAGQSAMSSATSVTVICWLCKIADIINEKLKRNQQREAV